MKFNFDQLDAHAARTRKLTARKNQGSGTVSNVSRAAGSACIADRREIENLDVAENRTGWDNLLHLCSEAYLTGFYFKPRIDRALLEQRSEGIIAINGHLGSEIGEYLLSYEETGDPKQWERAVESAASGRFTLTGCDGGGVYSVDVRYPTMSRPALSATAVRPNEAPLTIVVPRAGVPSCFVSGRLVDATGTPYRRAARSSPPRAWRWRKNVARREARPSAIAAATKTRPPGRRRRPPGTP